MNTPNVFDYDNLALKRDNFVKKVGKNIAVEGNKGNAFFMAYCEKEILNAKKALELCTGTGVIPKWMGHLKKPIVSIDSSSNMIKIASKNCRGFPWITFLVANINSLPFDDQSFSLVLKRLAPDNLKEIRRVLKSGGNFLNFTNGEKDGLEIKKMFGLPIHESVNEFREKLHQGQFNIFYEKEFVFTETYHSLEVLDSLLQIAPLIPDYNSNSNKYLPILKEYFAKNSSLVITRHKFFSHAYSTI